MTFRKIILSLAVLLFATGFTSPSMQGQTFTMLHAFTGGSDGAEPAAPLIISNGSLFGSAQIGGISGFGTIFRMNAQGKEDVLFSFSGTDGSDPYSRLVRDGKGNFYGATVLGGEPSCIAGSGCGVVFKLDDHGSETVLHIFSGEDGSEPQGVVIDSAGNLYGSASYGGDLSCPAYENTGCGVVFKVDSLGNETALYSFAGTMDGAFPSGNLIMDSKGDLYGVTFHGGTYLPAGVVFKVSETGGESVLYPFTGGTDGSNPVGALVRDGRGNLYGTTMLGGDLNCSIVAGEPGCGTLFKLDASGNETVLYSFTGNSDGSEPSGVIRDGKGNLYGVTLSGGDLSCPAGNGLGCGVVFKLDASGKKTTLHSFSGPTDGDFPSGLVLDAKGDLYGVAVYGGPNNGGTVFRITP